MPRALMGTPDISLILTRPALATRRFSRQLPEALTNRLTVVQSPLLAIVPVEVQIEISPNDAVIFTSANAVRFGPAGEGRRAFCVGQATTAAAHEAGWHAIFAGETADVLVIFLQSYPLSSRVWHLAGRHTRGRVVERLRERGVHTGQVIVYDQEFRSLTNEARAALCGANPVVVPIFSPRTALRFAQDCPKNAHPYVVALSPAVAEPLADLPLRILEVADSPTAQSMVSAVEKLVARISLG